MWIPEFCGIEFASLLLCSYRQTNAVVRLCQTLTYAEMINGICLKFDGLSPEMVLSFFTIPRYNRFKVVCDEDVQNMLSLAKSFELDHIDVIVQKRNMADEDDRSAGGEQMFVVHDRFDLLPSYCQHRSKTYLSAGWASGVTNVGQMFMGGANEFRTVLSKYDVECGFQFKYIKNDSVRVTAVCKFAGSTGCIWLVHARVLALNGVRERNKPSRIILLIKIALLRTTSLYFLKSQTNPHTGSGLVANVVADRVHAQPMTRPTDGVFVLKNDYGLDISNRVAWLGVEKARGEVYGDQAVSFDQLRWYSNAVMANNPNSYINLEFKQRIRRFKGNLLAATAKDGNQGLFLVVFAIVDSENAANWEWCLRQLVEVVDGDRPLTFVSDRHIGLLQAIPHVFPLAHHAFYLVHLQMNLKDRMKYVNAEQKNGLMRKLRECAYAPTVTSFNQKIEVLKSCSPAVVGDFLKDLHPEHWANAYFRGCRYGEMSSNAAESFNNWIREARHLPITQLVDAIRRQIMGQISKRMMKCSKWAAQICPKMETKLEDEYKSSRAWIVSQSDEDVYEVHSHPSVLVHVNRRACSCYQWQLNGFPCAHAVVAFRNSGRNIYDSIEAFYHVTEFKASYSESIYPIPTVDKPTVTPNDYLIAPPVVKRPPARLKRRRIPSKGVVVQRIWCSRCGKMGNHNMKT
ncbi:hypothetical protein ACSBR2_027304 [Camellia fascicularis]